MVAFKAFLIQYTVCKMVHSIHPLCNSVSPKNVTWALLSWKGRVCSSAKVYRHQKQSDVLGFRWKGDEPISIDLIKRNYLLVILPLQSCTITKQKSDSALYVTYGANMRLYGCHGCCKRWYITFNGNECSPIPIDGVVYQIHTNNMNLHRHRNIAG